MIQPEIKSYNSPDVEDVERFTPPSGSFCVLVQFYIGPSEGPGVEQFTVQVVSPEYLAESGTRFLKAMIVQNEYNFAEVLRLVTKRVTASRAPTWDEVGQKIGMYLHWEFEDYRE